MGYTAPWYSARDAGAGLLAGRGFGWLGCYMRDDDDRVYETYWTTDRGNEAGFWSYGLLDRTVSDARSRGKTPLRAGPRFRPVSTSGASTAARWRNGTSPTNRFVG